MTEIQLLKDKDTVPSAEALKDIFSDSLFEVYSALIFRISNVLNSEYEWRYYNDGKAWLCKVTFKKKTVCWISAWEDYIKAGFYFSEKYTDDILLLPVKHEIIEDFRQRKPIGKLRVVVIELSDARYLDDFLTFAEFKKTVK